MMQTNYRRRILLVEDDPHDTELTLGVLQTGGIAGDIDVVKDGEEALDYLYRRNGYKDRSESDPVLIILDLKMPKLGGAETLQRVKADERFKCLPIIMLTSSRETQDVRMCYRLGANGYVVKPVNAKQFAKTIKELATYWLWTNEAPP
jgi:CheY-like chemotaxis protein